MIICGLIIVSGLMIIWIWTWTHLHISWQWEVLPEGVTLKAIICQDASEVGVVGKEDPEHVPHLFRRPHHSQVVIILVFSLLRFTATLRTRPERQSPTHLPLVPVGGHVDRDRWVHGRQLICVRLHTNARVVAQRQQVVHDLETKHSLRNGGH